jgi:RNA polymerase sigma-70 factor (family 1)
LLNGLQEETEILSDLQNGDESAFERIYKLYSPRLYGRLLKLVKSKAQAQEILQEVFLKLWEHRRSINLEKSFRSFLFKIAENKVYDFYRKAERDKKLGNQLVNLASKDYTQVEEFKTGEENLAILQRAIDDLPPQRQQVFRLCKLDGKSYKEVSELLSISVSTISDHIVKGTKSIREHFEKLKITHMKV